MRAELSTLGDEYTNPHHNISLPETYGIYPASEAQDRVALSEIPQLVNLNYKSQLSNR